VTASEIYLRTRWSAGWVGANLKVHNGFRLNVHVEEADGTVVEGATVVLTDAYGTSTIDTTTDASGDITRTDVAKNIWTVTIPNTDAEWGGPSNYKTYSWLLASYPDVCDFKLYAPFTLTITKAGKGVYKAILDPDQDDWFPAGINLRVTLPRAGFETKILDSTIYDSTIY